MNAEATNMEEESMEDILHSIRDIIADSPDDKAANDATEEEDEDEEILELTDVVAPEENSDNAENAITEEPEKNPDDPTDILADIDEALDEEEELNEQLNATTEDPAEDNNDTEEIKPTTESPSAADPAPTEASHHDDINSLISGDAANKAGSTIKNLINTLPKNEIDSPVTRTGTTLEDLVIEAIKPMLSDWLDQNLPTMVERIVKHEIKKLIKEEIDA